MTAAFKLALALALTTSARTNYAQTSQAQPNQVQTSQHTPLQDEPVSVPPLVYPAEAKSARVQGTVHLEIAVDSAGHVTSVHALDGPLLLRQAAIDAYSQATYKPLLKNGQPTPALITTSVNFSLKELPPDTDLLVDRQFQPLQAHCQSFVDLGVKSERTPEALPACRQALEMSHRFTPTAQLESRATAIDDLVLVLLAQKSYAEAATVAGEAVALVDTVNHPHTPAVATAYITRCEARSLAKDYPGAADDCATAEETLTTLIADQSAPDESKVDRTANYKIQLREVFELHAIVLDKQHQYAEARRLRSRAKKV